MTAKILLAQTHVVSNPYNKPKDVAARTVFCETCDKALNAKDWPTHERSKGHKAMKDKAITKAAAGATTQNEAMTRKERTANWADASGPENGGEWGATEGAAWGADAVPTENGAGEWSGEAVNAGGCGESGATGEDGFNPAPRRNGGGNNRGNGGARGGGGGGGGGDGCYKCGGSGHFARECPNAGNSGGGGGCYNCGKEGHMSRDCTEPRKFTGTCNNCGEVGHRKGDCPKSAGGGGGRACYNCGHTNHISKECPQQRQPHEGSGGRACHNCGVEGHMSRECPEPRKRNPRGPKCFGCNDYGHKRDQCPANGDAGCDGSYGNNGGYVNASVGLEEVATATGDWANGNDESAEAPVEASGDW